MSLLERDCCRQDPCHSVSLLEGAISHFTYEKRGSKCCRISSCFCFSMLWWLFLLTFLLPEALAQLMREPATPCNSNWDCRDDEYCGNGICRPFGTCESRVDCLNLANDYWWVDDCPGFIACRQGSCEMSCEGSLCPDGLEQKDCGDVATCQAEMCDEPYESCVSESCGGCHSYFFNSAGKQVCEHLSQNTEEEKEDINLDESDMFLPCASENDCDSGEFCGSGVCRPFQTCDNLVDCLNPENEYFVPECAGYLVCTNDSVCEMSCNGFFCPNGQDPERCEDACEKNSCDEAFEHCWTEKCGECRAVRINEAGLEVCTESSSSPSNNIACESDQDCQAGLEFCMGGECQPMMTCDSLADCLNPSNKYNVADCVGFMTCEAGLCGKQCSNHTCPDNDDPVNCFADPCQVSTCEEDYVTCQPDFCGGCKAIYLDAAGNHVCQSTMPKAPPSTCQSDSDCVSSDWYCSKGTCRRMGECSSWIDCVNPSNVISVQECSGFLDCIQGQCQHSCSNNTCADDQPSENCSASPPCDASQCGEDYVTCIETNCQTCEAVFLNAAGEQVCTMESYCNAEVTCHGGGGHFLDKVLCILERVRRLILCEF